MAQSREWVCVRLASYEDQQEGDYLVELFQGRSGLLNNTTFALLAPDGKTLLAPSGRGPEFVLGKRGNPRGSAPPEDTAAFAQKLADQAEGIEAKADLALLPQSLDVRRALVIAACDNQPLVVLYATSEKELRKSKAQLSALAWSEEFVGRLQFIVATSRENLASISGLPEGDFLAVVQPGQFGLKGKVLGSLATTTTEKELAMLLRQSLQSFSRKDLPMQQHRQQGRRADAIWKTVMPVTDEGAPPQRGEAPPRD